MTTPSSPSSCPHPHRARVLPLLDGKPCGPEHDVCRDCGAVEAAGGAMVVTPERFSGPEFWCEGASTVVLDLLDQKSKAGLPVSR